VKIQFPSKCQVFNIDKTIIMIELDDFPAARFFAEFYVQNLKPAGEQNAYFL